MGARRGLTKHLPAAYSIDREPHRHQSPSKRAAPLHRHRSPSRPGRTLSLGADGQPACCRCGGDLAGSSSSRSARSSTSVTLSSSDDSSRLLYPGDVTNGLMERLHISTNGSMPIEIHGGLHSGFHGEISSGLNSGFHGGIHGGIPSREDEAGWKLFSSPPRHQRRVTLKSERSGSVERPRFIPVTSLEDVQAIRCAEFHPFGKLYAIGSNSKTLRICSYPKLVDLRDDHVTCQSSVVLKRPRHHKGSIYCMAWSPVGDLIATGSNDKTIKLMRFDADSCTMEEPAAELTMHDGTVRDVCFIEDMSNKSSLLVSGGAGDCKIYVTDCATGVPFQALSGHTGTVLSLSTWGGAMFVSGSQDRTVRVWDLRSRGCVNRLQPPSVHTASRGSPVASLAVEPSGRLLVSGHEDSSCVLYDLRGDRVIQAFRPHDGDVRSVRFSPHAFYLLTAGYDNRLVLSDLQGDLTMPLPSVVVAQHQDKVITGRWHPYEFSFLSTGADKTCTLWALPPV